MSNRQANLSALSDAFEEATGEAVDLAAWEVSKAPPPVVI